MSAREGGAPLVIFDIDGTLTQTMHIDEACYEDAVRREWGITGISTDWGAYEHSTDNAIASEIFRTHRGRDVTHAELAALRERFAGLIYAGSDSEFVAVPGAAELLAALPALGWRVAIATGGWTLTAQHKLERAGIPWRGIPAAFACDARPREEIIRIAATRAGVSTLERVIYIGDGVWDARACRRLGIPFVGVGEGPKAERLRAEGATQVLADYRDRERVVDALRHAEVP
ncbi:MAG: HAD family hydrolase [Phycisphaerae bacterium]|nr:HAD family hydrolase [Phycisphaerae bacterium]